MFCVQKNIQRISRIFSCQLLRSHLSTLSQKQVIKFEESYARTINVNVCGKFAEHAAFRRPWFLRYIPRGGLPYEISYIDTKPDAGPNDKVIVALHNTPGSYYDYFEFLATFGDEYRVLIPNFPDFSYTLKNSCFWHSGEEKSEFVSDFLKALNVQRVDCLIAHSMAAYTASYLWLYANWESYFKLHSVCLLSPIGMYKLPILERMSLKMMSNMCRNPVTRKILERRIQNERKSRLVAKTMIPDVQSGTMLANFEVSSWKALTLQLSGYENYHYRLRLLAEKNLPILFQFSSNDRLYSPNTFFDQLYELGATQDSYDIYEQYENELVQCASNPQAPIRALDFRSAGHYMFKTHPDIVHSYIAELLQRADTVANQKRLQSS